MPSTKREEWQENIDPHCESENEYVQRRQKSEVAFENQHLGFWIHFQHLGCRSGLEGAYPCISGLTDHCIIEEKSMLIQQIWDCLLDGPDPGDAGKLDSV